MQTTVQYRNDFRDDMSKITEHYFHCGDIQIPTERDRLVLKWLQKWQNPTFFLGIFNLKLKKTIQYWNDFKDDRHQHLLWGHSKSNWKRQFSIEKIYKITKLYILCGDIQILTEKDGLYWNDYKDDKTLFYFLGHSNSNWQNLTLHLLLGHSKSNWKRQFSIEMISKMTESYILCRNIQFPTEKDCSVSQWFQRWQNITSFEGRFRSQLKKTV